MPVNEWRGDAQAVAQRRRFTVGGVPQAGDIPTITVNRKEVSYVVTGADTLATIAEALAAAWAAATFPESKEATAEYTAAGVFLDLLAAEEGVPFTATASVGGAGPTTTLTPTDVTASTGPMHVDDPDNWSTGLLPDPADDVVIPAGAAMRYGLGSFTVNSVEYRATYTEPVGLPRWNARGYVEYRPRVLTWDTAAGRVGTGPGNGSGQMFLGVVAGSTWTVEKTGSRLDEALPSVEFSAAGTVTAVLVSGGADVGLNVEDVSAARTYTTVRVSGDETRLTTGTNTTVTNLDEDRGGVDAYGVVTNPTIGEGNYTQHSGNFVTMVARGGYIRLRHAGAGMTITAEGRGDGTLAPVIDCEDTNGAKEFANSTFKGGAVLYDSNKTVTLAGAGTHTADSAFFQGSRIPPVVTWTGYT